MRKVFADIKPPLAPASSLLDTNEICWCHVDEHDQNANMQQFFIRIATIQVKTVSPIDLWTEKCDAEKSKQWHLSSFLDSKHKKHTYCDIIEEVGFCLFCFGLEFYGVLPLIPKSCVNQTK